MSKIYLFLLIPLLLLYSCQEGVDVELVKENFSSFVKMKNQILEDFEPEDFKSEVVRPLNSDCCTSEYVTNISDECEIEIENISVTKDGAVIFLLDVSKKIHQVEQLFIFDPYGDLGGFEFESKDSEVKIIERLDVNWILISVKYSW